jgi:hypothetical protein
VLPEPNHVFVEFNQVSLIMRLVSLTMFGEFNHAGEFNHVVSLSRALGEFNVSGEFNHADC